MITKPNSSPRRTVKVNVPLLTAYMKKHKFNPSSLGRKVGVSKTAVNRWLDGSKMNIESFKKLLEIFDIRPSELLDGEALAWFKTIENLVAENIVLLRDDYYFNENFDMMERKNVIIDKLADLGYKLGYHEEVANKEKREISEAERQAQSLLSSDSSERDDLSDPK